MIDNEMLEFHKKNGYVVKVQRLKHTNGVSIEFPSKVLVGKPINAEKLVYRITPSGVELNNGHEVIRKVMSDYVRRPMILADYMARCLELNIEPILTVLYDENGNELEGQNDLIHLLEPTENQLGQQLEKSLLRVFNELLSGSDAHQLAITTGVVNGYTILLDTLQSGGMQND